MKIVNIRLVSALLFICIAISFSPFYLKGMASEADNSVSQEYQQKFGGGYAVTGQLKDIGYSYRMYDATNGLPTSDANYILGGTDG